MTQSVNVGVVFSSIELAKQVSMTFNICELAISQRVNTCRVT